MLTKQKLTKGVTILGIGLLSFDSPGVQASEECQIIRGDLLNIGYGHLTARALHFACHYKLFDALQEANKTGAEIAALKNYHPDVVKRMLRALVSAGVLRMDEGGIFSLNEKSKILVSTHPNSLQPAFAKEYDLKRWQAIGSPHLLLNGHVAPFDKLFGMPYYEYLATDPVAAELFNNGMKNFSEQEDQEISTHFDFRSFKTYCDVGGGPGGLISQIQTQFPNLKPILLELPEAIGLCSLKNVEKVEGSFFEKIPEADVYTIKRVLHNWKDHECVTILQNAHNSLTDQEKGRILVVEKVLPTIPDDSFLYKADLIGLALGGIERTWEEFTEIAKKAELVCEKRVELPSGISILVFKPE